MKVKQTDLLEKLKQSISDQFTVGNVDPKTGEATPLHARDLIALGNLVLKLQEREDKLEDAKATKSGTLTGVVAFPALPARSPKDALKARRLGKLKEG
jgi:hypothetical protein